MDSLELCVILGLALEIHLLEHLQGRFLRPDLISTRGTPRLNGADEVPTRLPALEAESLAIVASSDDLVLGAPDQALEGQELSGDGNDSFRRLVGTTGIYDRDATIVSSKSKAITTGGEGHGVYPTSRVVQVLATYGVEWQPLTPDAGLRSLVHALDEAGEDTGVRIGRAGSKEHRVGVPVNAGNGAANGLLEVFGHPPIVLLLEIAHGDEAVTGANGELGLGGRPSNECGGTADSKQD